jgi:hypothetical protein
MSVNIFCLFPLLIGQYLSCRRKLDGVIIFKAGFQTQLRASPLSISCGMSTLGMARQRGDGRLQGGRQPAHGATLQGLDAGTSDLPSTHGHLACRHGTRQQELGPRGQKPFACGGGNRGPHQSLDAGRSGRVKGLPMGVRCPLLKQSCSLPSPCVGPTAPRTGVSFRWQVRQTIAQALGTRVPAQAPPQAQAGSVDRPLSPACDPRAFGEWGVDGLARLVAPRAQAVAVLAHGRDDGRMPPRFGPPKQEAALLLDAAQRVPVERATIRQPHTGAP